MKRQPCWVEGLRLTHVLSHHRGCVNTMEWHPSGHELLSSGDDLDIGVWDAANDFVLRGHYRTGHSRNVFCIKYVPYQNSTGFLSCGMDGEIRLTDLVQQQDHSLLPRVECLSRSDHMALKMEFLPNNPMSFLCTHQDGTIRLMDLRNARRTGTAGDAPSQTVRNARLPPRLHECFLTSFEAGGAIRYDVLLALFRPV